MPNQDCNHSNRRVQLINVICISNICQWAQKTAIISNPVILLDKFQVLVRMQFLILLSFQTSNGITSATVTLTDSKKISNDLEVQLHRHQVWTVIRASTFHKLGTLEIRINHLNYHQLNQKIWAKTKLENSVKGSDLSYRKLWSQTRIHLCRKLYFKRSTKKIAPKYQF